MITGCSTCDVQGPAINTAEGDFEELHRAVHDLWRELHEQLKPIIQISRVLMREYK